jgi:transcriptional regulator with XRE-family HTH domain
MAFDGALAAIEQFNDQRLGAVIRTERRKQGVSQTELATRCGITFQQIQKYENGINRISYSRLLQIAAALNVKTSELVILAGGDAENSVSIQLEDPILSLEDHLLLRAAKKLPLRARRGLLDFLQENAKAA